jgi:hypothetical protein
MAPWCTKWAQKQVYVLHQNMHLFPPAVQFTV